MRLRSINLYINSACYELYMESGFCGTMHAHPTLVESIKKMGGGFGLMKFLDLLEKIAIFFHNFINHIIWLQTFSHMLPKSNLHFFEKESCKMVCCPEKHKAGDKACLILNADRSLQYVSLFHE